MVVHVMDSLEKGFNSVLIRTVDTDVIVVLIVEFHAIKIISFQNFGAFHCHLVRHPGVSKSILQELLQKEQNIGKPPPNCCKYMQIIQEIYMIVATIVL